jgi:hypothetical protein
MQPYRWIVSATVVMVVAAITAACKDTSPAAVGDECRAARESCEAEGRCWTLATEGTTSGAVGYDPTSDSASANASDSRSCNIQCVACVTQTTSSQPQDTPTTSADLNQAIADWAETACEQDMLCHSVWVNYSAGDEQYCRAATQSVMQWQASLPDSGVTAEALTKCSDDYVRSGCEPRSLDCFRGPRADGMACANGSQCQSGWCTGWYLACGLCVPRPTVNTACSTDSECLFEHHCANGRCVVDSGQDQACNDQTPCAAFLRCHENLCTHDDRQQNQTCGEDVGYCDQTTAQLACDTSTSTCRPVTFADAGEPCPTFGWCRGLGACYQGICRRGPEPGDPCDPANGCRWPAFCQDGTCRAVPTSDPCTGS